MFKRFLHGFVLIALLGGMLAVAPVRPAAAAVDSEGVSPAGMLNPDGTLKLDANFRGALDLEGYNVQLDPARGPVFTPLAAQDNWEALAEGGGAFDSTITTIVVNGATVYVGGGFRDAGGNPEADYLAKWNGTQWTAIGHNGSGNGALTGPVYAIWLDGPSLYIGGAFSATYNSSGSPIANASYLAKWTGLFWSAVPGVTAPLNGSVYAFGSDSTNNILYFGGGFTDVNGEGTADKIAGIDFDTSALVTLGNNGSGDGSLNNSVGAIGLDSSGNVYAGGFFTDVNNGGTPLPEADRIAKWDGADWSALGNNGAGVGALNSGVYAIAIDGSNNVYAGGWFSDAAGIAEADYIAKWNGSAWSALGSNGAGNGALISANGNPVQEIAINGSDIYVGGAFTGSSGIPTVDYAARFDTGTNTWFGLGSDGSGNGSLKGAVLGMTFSGGNLYLGGAFYDVNNGGTVLPTADYFAIWDGSDWSTLGSSNGGLHQTVKAVAKIGTNVYVGGNFSDLGGDSRMDYLARWDGSAWNPVGNLTQTQGSLNSQVSALAVDGTDLYVGGYFSSAQNEGSSVSGTSRIAKWDGSTWSALGGGVSGAVFALAVDSSHNVYAGGDFTDAASIPEADYIAMWNGSAWSALAGNGAGNGALNSYVTALAISGSNVYAGGGFTSVVDTSNTAIPNTARLAKWSGSAWSAMDGITSPVSSFVYALAVSGSDLYVGGQFADLNGISAADKIAKWDGSTWSALGSDGSGGGSLTQEVRAIVVDGGNVYVGGQFTNVNNGGTVLNEADYLARWDGSNWSALGNNGAGDGSLNSYVYALKVVDNDLWTGGDFTNVNNGGTVIKEADFLAAFGVAPVISKTFRSQGANDGWTLESTETSGKGGSLNSSASTFRLGDDASDKQYRSILSFNTASLPDTAVITRVTLKIKQYGAPVGTNPFTILGGLKVDIRKPYFGTAVGLSAHDFQSAAGKSTIGSIPNTPVSNWYTKIWSTDTFFSFINLTGTTQFRLRFLTDDNNDNGADYMRFYSGEAATSYRPQLIIEYYVP